MSTTISMADAAVALRSLPRRYREIVAGPVGDDAWDRIVRTFDASGRSALGWVSQTSDAVTALGTAIAALPLSARPTVDLAKIVRAPSNVPMSNTVTELLKSLSEVCERAAAAIGGRQHDDFDRQCVVDGQDTAARALVATVVQLGVSNLRHAREAVDSARSPIV